MATKKKYCWSRKLLFLKTPPPRTVPFLPLAPRLMRRRRLTVTI